jgi:hypothetical protein
LLSNTPQDVPWWLNSFTTTDNIHAPGKFTTFPRRFFFQFERCDNSRVKKHKVASFGKNEECLNRFSYQLKKDDSVLKRFSESFQ